LPVDPRHVRRVVGGGGHAGSEVGERADVAQEGNVHIEQQKAIGLRLDLEATKLVADVMVVTEFHGRMHGDARTAPLGEAADARGRLPDAGQMERPGAGIAGVFEPAR
jgi:hypothetical protein